MNSDIRPGKRSHSHTIIKIMDSSNFASSMKRGIPNENKSSEIIIKTTQKDNENPFSKSNEK